MTKFLIALSVLSVGFLLFSSTANATDITVYQLEYRGHTISLNTDMSEGECISLKDEIEEPHTNDLSCVPIEVKRELI